MDKIAEHPVIDPDSEVLDLVAYRLPGTNHAQIVPARAPRAWMQELPGQFANRCLPLLLANQSGWLLLNPDPIRIVWDGGPAAAAVTIEYPEGHRKHPIATSVFGHGIVTWRVDYLFRTSPGYNLFVSGPTNTPKDGIQALQGVVETDWTVASFTMNWKITRPDQMVEFAAGEPFCMIAPQRRNELARFHPRIVPIEERPELEAEWREFERRRKLMTVLRHLTLQKGGPAAVSKIPWERHYFEGTTPTGAAAPEHQKKLSLRPFDPVEVEDSTPRRS